MHRPPPTHLYSSGMTDVIQLIGHEQKTCKVDVLEDLFDSNTVKQITNIRLPFTGMDKLRWEPSHKGNQVSL